MRPLRRAARALVGQVHAFDGWEQHDRPWRAPGDISCSIIHAGQHKARVPNMRHPIYGSGEQGGLILRPGHTPIGCGKGGDSGGHCGERAMCPSLDPNEDFDADAWNVDYPGDGCWGSWQLSDFSGYLMRQAAFQRRNSRLGHNEIIVHGGHFDFMARQASASLVFSFTDGRAHSPTGARL